MTGIECEAQAWPPQANATNTLLVVWIVQCRLGRHVSVCSKVSKVFAKIAILCTRPSPPRIDRVKPKWKIGKKVRVDVNTVWCKKMESELRERRRRRRSRRKEVPTRNQLRMLLSFAVWLEIYGNLCNIFFHFLFSCIFVNNPMSAAKSRILRATLPQMPHATCTILSCFWWLVERENLVHILN